MRCPQCLKNIQESINQCQCGFSFNHVPFGELHNWFTELKQVLETAYTIASRIERLLTDFVTKNGKPIISQYRSRHDDLTQGWIEKDLAAWGFEVVSTYSGYSGNGLELCRVVVVR